MDLTVGLTNVITPSAMNAVCAALARPELICDRCEKVDEIVVAIMQIWELDITWALCGYCAAQLPAGFIVT